ncbi:MAG: hypothetical protein PHT51_04670 [Patescibacteria group bacterium]|nr:hypothetical protein [Patescibacteria group bacterium]MDD4610965.1 hypothetical protein [Patescibacteria group bacterium]
MYKLASIFSTASSKTKTACEVFISQPDANKEALAGKLFILAEIESGKADALKIINFLVNSLNHNYYQNEKVILRERISSLKIEHIFESSLAKTNKDLADFIEKEKIKISPAAFNITAGVICDNELHFSGAGKNRAFLIYKSREDKFSRQAKNKLHEEELKYKIAEISKKTANLNAQNLTKLFSDVISGPVALGSVFLFSNEALPEYLSHNQIIDVLTKLPPLGAAEQIKNLLENINSYVSFLGIIIKDTTGFAEKTTSEKPYLKQKTNNSTPLANLNAAEEKTEKLLSPSGAVNLNRWLKIPLAFITKIKNPTITKEKKFFLKEQIFVKRKSSWEFIKNIGLIIKKIAINIFGFIVFIFGKIIDKNFWLRAGGKIKLAISKIKTSALGFAAWFKALDKKNKIIFSTAAGCLVILVISLSWTIFRNKVVEKRANLTALIQNIELKQNQVEADFLYGNEDDAKKILTEIKDIFSQFGDNEITASDEYKKIAQKNNEQLEKIRHATIIENPKEIANFFNLNAGADPLNLSYIDGKLYASDSKQKSIYTVNLKDNLATVISNGEINITALDYPSPVKNGNIYYLNNNSLVELNSKDGKTSQTTINIPVGRENISTMSGYSSKLYLLDNKNNQIYRYKNSADGFRSYDKLIGDIKDFSQAVSLAIDGDVYILNKNGVVYKYLSGKSEEFNIDQIDPLLTEADKIMVSPEEEGFIYISEVKNNRLAVFDKTGKFLMQYKISNLNNLKDFSIDEAAKKIYILAGSSVYGFDATHLNK